MQASGSSGQQRQQLPAVSLTAIPSTTLHEVHPARPPPLTFWDNTQEMRLLVCDQRQLVQIFPLVCRRLVMRGISDQAALDNPHLLQPPHLRALLQRSGPGATAHQLGLALLRTVFDDTQEQFQRAGLHMAEAYNDVRATVQQNPAAADSALRRPAWIREVLWRQLLQADGDTHNQPRTLAAVLLFVRSPAAKLADGTMCDSCICMKTKGQG